MPASIKSRIHPIFKRKRFLISCVLLAVAVFGWYWYLRPLALWMKQHHLTRGVISSLIFSSSYPLETADNRINVLLLGIAGGDHDGPNLTDTMIFTSLHATENDAVFLSLPRDIWLPSLKQKINTAYAIGEGKQKGGGLILAKAAVEEVIGQHIPFAWKIDFSGFTKIIDMVGGITITVPETIDDSKYPIPGKENDLCGTDTTYSCRYEHLHFDPGPQHMTGERALKYVRSRQAVGDEGTDFSRSKRQQQVLLALKDTILAKQYWRHPQQARQLVEAMQQTTETDMPLGETLLFLRRFLAISDQHIRHPLLDDGDEKTNRPGFLINPPTAQYDNLWVLTPRSGSFKEIQQYITCQIENPACTLHP